MCNLNIVIPPPREIAKNLLKYHYSCDYLPPIDWFNNMYSGCSHYSAEIGGWINGKRAGQDKIVVETGKDKQDIYVFSLKDIYREVAEEVKMQKMGVQQLSLI